MPLPSSEAPHVEDIPRQIAFGRHIVEASAALRQAEEGQSPSPAEQAVLAELCAVLENASTERSVSVLPGSLGLVGSSDSAVFMEAIGTEHSEAFARMADAVRRAMQGAVDVEQRDELTNVRKLLLAVSEVRASHAARPLAAPSAEAWWPTRPSLPS